MTRFNDSSTDQTNAQLMAAVAFFMRNFTSKIVRHVVNGGEFDDSAFETIKTQCLIQAKDTGGTGMSIIQEASALNSAVALFSVYMDAAIADGLNKGRN